MNEDVRRGVDVNILEKSESTTIGGTDDSQGFRTLGAFLTKTRSSALLN